MEYDDVEEELREYFIALKQFVEPMHEITYYKLRKIVSGCEESQFWAAMQVLMDERVIHECSLPLSKKKRWRFFSKVGCPFCRNEDRDWYGEEV